MVNPGRLNGTPGRDNLHDMQKPTGGVKGVV